MPDTTKVQIVPLAVDLLLATDDNAGWVYSQLDLGEAESWGPYLSQIRVHTVTKNRTDNHKWTVVIEWSADGNRWFPNPIDASAELFTPIILNGQKVNAAFSNQALFGLHMRYSMACQPTTGTAVESATVSAWAELTFKS